MNKTPIKTYKLTLKLTEREIELLRNSTSDLGFSERECISLQLKIADELLDVGYSGVKKD